MVYFGATFSFRASGFYHCISYFTLYVHSYHVILFVKYLFESQIWKQYKLQCFDNYLKARYENNTNYNIVKTNHISSKVKT